MYVTSPGVAWPRHQSHKPTAASVERTVSSTTCCPVPANVWRYHVRAVRRFQRATTAASRASSRSSAPYAFTTALQPSASASVPPMRVSHALESFEAGAMYVVASVMVIAT